MPRKTPKEKINKEMVDETMDFIFDAERETDQREGLLDFLENENENFPKGVRKTSDTETAIRHNTIYAKLVAGWTVARVREFAVTNWGVSAEMAKHYIDASARMMKTETEARRSTFFDEQLSHLFDQRMQAITREDFHLVLKINQELNKLLSLYEPTKIDLTSGGEKINIIYQLPTQDEINRIEDAEIVDGNE